MRAAYLNLIKIITRVKINSIHGTLLCSYRRLGCTAAEPSTLVHLLVHATAGLKDTSMLMTHAAVLDSPPKLMIISYILLMYQDPMKSTSWLMIVWMHTCLFLASPTLVPDATYFGQIILKLL